jgi:hypothetical protein
MSVKSDLTGQLLKHLTCCHVTNNQPLYYPQVRLYFGCFTFARTRATNDKPVDIVVFTRYDMEHSPH